MPTHPDRKDFAASIIWSICAAFSPASISLFPLFFHATPNHIQNSRRHLQATEKPERLRNETTTTTTKRETNDSCKKKLRALHRRHPARALRGRPYMTFAQFSGFWTPLSAFGTEVSPIKCDVLTSHSCSKRM